MASKGDKSKAEAEYARANKLYRDKKFDEAAEAFSQAIELSPSHWKYYFNRALTLLQLKRPAEVFKDITSTLMNMPEITPSTPKSVVASKSKALYVRGLAAAQLSRRADAISDLQEALHVDPNNEPAKKKLRALQGGANSSSSASAAATSGKGGSGAAANAGKVAASGGETKSGVSYAAAAGAAANRNKTGADKHLRDDDDTPDVPVSWDDQQRINRFGRLNQRYSELRENLKTAKNDLENIDDCLNEVSVAIDDDACMFKFGEIFVPMESDDAESRLEKMKVEKQSEVEALEKEADELTGEMESLKGLLYAKFGSAINLETGDDD